MDFGANMLPFSLQKSTKIGSKINLGRHQLFVRFFLSIFARFGKPTWRHVGHFFAQNGAPLWDPALFFVRSMFFFGFLAVLTPSWHHFGSFLAPSWRLWNPSWLKIFGSILLPSWRYVAPFWRKSWHWMGWWGYAKR